MSLTVNETLQVQDNVTETPTIGGTQVTLQQQVNQTYNWTAGTGLNKINENWIKSGVVLAASASNTYTLSALTDDLGRAIVFVKVRKFRVTITTIVDGDFLTIAPGVTHGWTGFLSGTSPVITTSGEFLMATLASAGYPVVATTTDQVTIHNGGSNSITYTISITGE